jgi:hypothetical protein
VKREVKEAIGDLGHEDAPESPVSKLGQLPPPPEELEPEEGEFDAREYLTSGLDLGQYLEPMGFIKRDNVRDGVVVYGLLHLSLDRPAQYYAKDGTVQDITWANIHVRFDAVAVMPFWRVLVSPGHQDSFFTNLQRVKIVRLNPRTAGDMQWVPDAVDRARAAIDVVRQPCYGHLAALTHRLKQAEFSNFNS